MFVPIERRPCVLTRPASRALRVLSVFVSCLLVACGDGSSNTAPDTKGNSPPAAVSSMDLSETTLRIFPGDTVRLLATPRDAAGNALGNRAVTWSSSDSAVVVVSSTGLVTAIVAGRPATVTATSGGKSRAAVVTTVTLAIARPALMRDTVRGVGVSFSLRAVTRDYAGLESGVSGAKWTSSDASIASIDSVAGLARTFNPGRAMLTLTVGGKSAVWTIEVVRVRHVAVDPYLASPAVGALWEIPVVLVEYLPTADGTTIDTLKNPDFYYAGPMSLDSAEKRILTFAQRRKMGLEQGSRFHGYSDSTARPSLGYRVVDHFIVYDLTPPSGIQRDTRIPGSPRFPDWFAIFAQLQLEPIMRSKIVREIWIAESGMDGNYPSYNPATMKVEDMRTNAESNMSSPTTGDISNSFRIPNDLPILSHTYVVEGINYRRTQAESLHSHGHQMEAILSYVAQRQDGNDRLFWRDFVGQDSARQPITGRTGWTHMPPNTTTQYDYLNSTSVLSDIENWRPDGTGTRKPTSVATWQALKYPWPGAQEFDQRVESQWYTYWFQNFSGAGNRIPRGTAWMTNWWAFVGDWDAAIRSGLGLSSPTPAATSGSGASPIPVASVTRAAPWPVVESVMRRVRPQ